MGLKDELKDVIVPEPSTGDTDSAVEGGESDKRTSTPDSGTGNKAGQDASDNDKSTKERSVDNLAKEMNRKFSALLEENKRLRESIEQSLKPQQSQQPTVQGTRPIQDIDKYSTEELRAAANNAAATPMLRQTIQEEITRRIATESALAASEGRDKNRMITQMKERANYDALNAYPHLRDENSAFYREVDREVKMRSVFGESPTIVLDAANAVASRMGITPKAQPKSPVSTSFLASGRSSAPAPSPEDDSVMSDEQFNDLSSRLSQALPKGKTFAKDKIDKKAAFYKQNSQTYMPKISR